MLGCSRNRVDSDNPTEQFMKMIHVFLVAGLAVSPLFASASPNFAISCNVYEGTASILDAKKLSNWEPLGFRNSSYTWMRGQVFETASGEFTAIAEILESSANDNLELSICKGAHPMGVCDKILAHGLSAILRGMEVRISSSEANLTLLCIAEQ